MKTKPACPDQKPKTSRRWKLLCAAAASFLASALAFGRPYRPVEPLPTGIIDMHCHIAGLGYGGSGCFVSEKLSHNWRFNIYLKSFGVTRKDVETQGDIVIAERVSQSLAASRHVKKAVVLAMDGTVGKDGQLDTNRTEFYVPNEFVAEITKRHTNLLFGASINPYRADALARLAWAKEHGAVLVKWIPPIMEIDPSDPALEPFYRKLVELDLPLLTHTGGERSFSHAKDELSDPQKLRLPARLGVKIIAAHIASSAKYEGERGADRLARLMREYPNVYSDISALTQVQKFGCLKEALTRPEFSGRLFYGSDFPLINTLLTSPWYHCWHLGLKGTLRIAGAPNCWDRDVITMQQLGTPTEVFERSNTLVQEHR